MNALGSCLNDPSSGLNFINRGASLMKKGLLSSTAIVAASIAVCGAADAKPVVSLGGSFDFQVGWTSQDREGWSPTPGSVIGPSTERGYSFFNTSDITIKASDTTDSGMKWAFLVKLYAEADGGPGATNGTKSSGRDAANKVYLTLSDNWGQIKMGADHPMNHIMQINVAEAVGGAGTGGVDGDWARWVNDETVTSRYETGATLHDSTTSSNISYVTPRIAGIQAAMTFAPDHNTIGRFREPAQVTKKDEINWLEGIVRYDGKIDDVDVGASITGQHNQDSLKTYREGTAYQVGGVVGYRSWKVAGGYGWKADDGEALKTDTNTKFNLYDLGVGYTVNAWQLGISYLHQNAGVINSTGTDKQDLWSLGVTYDMGAGLQLYSDLNHLDNKGGSPNANPASNNEAVSLISGVRVKF